MSSASRWTVWGGAEAKDARSVDFIEFTRERSCGGRVPAGGDIAVGSFDGG